MTDIDPWGAGEIKIDEKLLAEFGLEPYSDDGTVDHHLFRRGLVVAHRDFGRIKQALKKGEKAVQVTGIASSGPLHLGHKVNIDVFKALMDAGLKSYYAVTDIDAYVSRPDNKVPDMAAAKKTAVANVADLIALGIPEESIYVQSQKEPAYYELAFALAKKLTENQFRATYGHVDPGKLAANLLQYADILHVQLPEYEGKCPTVTGIGVEQDPHARAARDMARKLGLELPSFIYFLHQGGLKEGDKMSASEPDTAIFLSDTPKDIERKVKKAFSGGRQPLEEHRRLGGVPEVDKAYEILRFHHPDDALVEDVYKRYKAGEMLTGELKQITIDFLKETLAEHQRKAKKALPAAERIVYGR